MSKNKKIGDWGEKLAIQYLESKGYQITAKNYRHSRFEIDLITKKDDLLVFIEVKTRSDVRFGYPEDWVDSNKAQRILEASENYIHEINWQKGIRYDIIAITKCDQPEIKHFEDAFH